MSDGNSSDSDYSGASKPTDVTPPVTGELLEESGCSKNSTTISGATVATTKTRRKLISRKTRALRSSTTRWRKHLLSTNRVSHQQVSTNGSSSSSSSSTDQVTSDGTISHSNNQQVLNPTELTTSNTDDNSLGDDDAKNLQAESADSAAEESCEQAVQNSDFSDQDQGEILADRPNSNTLFTNLEDQVKRSAEKTELANMIEKAVLDFCSSRTVETMRRMFAGATSEMEALQGEASRQGDKAVQAPHQVTGELVKEGIVIGSVDVFSPRVHREYRLEMKDHLVEGFLKDAGMFRSICYRTKCQLEVTRRLLNKKLCTGGRWVKYLIIRIVGPSLRAITCCDQLLQKAMPTFKHRIEYNKAAFCRLFFREDIPDNAPLYHCYQRTGGTSNRYGALRLETPYRLTAERTLGNCPWKSGALKIGKLSFNGSGGHLTMHQVYPGYGYTTTSPVEPECLGEAAVRRIEGMHSQFLTRRQLLLQDKRTMTIPVCR